MRSDTPATRRQPASNAAKPPLPPEHRAREEHTWAYTAGFVGMEGGNARNGLPQCRWGFRAWLQCRRRRQNSPSTPSSGISGTKLALHTPPRGNSGTKLALLARNGPFWRVLRVQGELCTAVASNKPSRAIFVPHTRWTRSQSTQPHTRHHRCRGRRRDRRARPRCWWAVAGPGRASRRGTERSEDA